MSIKIEYASSRREIWRWYWRSWRKTLWKTHLLFFLVVTFAAAFFIAPVRIEPNNSLSFASLLPAVICGLLSVSWLPFFPLLMFKPETRTLEIASDGISTTIGKRLGRRAWSEIRSVSTQGDEIVILVKNGNAFIVPARAFPSPDEQQQFLSFAQNALRTSSA